MDFAVPSIPRLPTEQSGLLRHCEAFGVFFTGDHCKHVNRPAFSLQRDEGQRVAVFEVLALLHLPGVLAPWSPRMGLSHARSPLSDGSPR